MPGEGILVREVRFTDVTAERVESLVARVDETGPLAIDLQLARVEVLQDDGPGRPAGRVLVDSANRAGASRFARAAVA